MNPNYGDSAYLKRGFQVDPKRLWASDEAKALTKLITLAPGYGILEAGTVVGKISESTGRLGQYVPYAIQAPSAGLPFIGGAYILADGGAAATSVNVTQADSWKFRVGDHLGGVDSDATPIDIGAITAIDRTTNTHFATISFAQIDISALTVGNGAMIFIQTDTADPYSTAVTILGEGVDTGVGEDAVGGQAMGIFSNAMLYNGLLPNLDAGAITDLSAIVDGQHLILK